MPKGRHFHCPVNGWDCPYYVDSTVIEGEVEYCLCGMGLPNPEKYGFDLEVSGMNPIVECDDFYSMWGACDPEDYTDYVEE